MLARAELRGLGQGWRRLGEQIGESGGVQEICRKTSGWSSGAWAQVLVQPRAPKKPQVSNLAL